MNREKQARLDAFEIREKWPELRAGYFWSLDILTKARRASVALFAADTRYCNIPNYSTEGAERRATKAAQELTAALQEAAPNVSGLRCQIHNNGLRYLEIIGPNNNYSLID